jgi:hypothetical protein
MRRACSTASCTKGIVTMMKKTSRTTAFVAAALIGMPALLTAQTAAGQ